MPLCEGLLCMTYPFIHNSPSLKGHRRKTSKGLRFFVGVALLQRYSYHTYVALKATKYGATKEDTFVSLRDFLG